MISSLLDTRPASDASSSSSANSLLTPGAAANAVSKLCTVAFLCANRLAHHSYRSRSEHADAPQQTRSAAARAKPHQSLSPRAFAYRRANTSTGNGTKMPDPACQMLDLTGRARRPTKPGRRPARQPAQGAARLRRCRLRREGPLKRPRRWDNDRGSAGPARQRLLQDCDWPILESLLGRRFTTGPEAGRPATSRHASAWKASSRST